MFRAAGIAEQIGKGMGVAVADYDGDGWMDIFVANDNQRNFLFKNRRGKGFDEVGVEAGVAYTECNAAFRFQAWGLIFETFETMEGPEYLLRRWVAKPSLCIEMRETVSSAWKLIRAIFGFPTYKMSGWGARNRGL